MIKHYKLNLKLVFAKKPKEKAPNTFSDARKVHVKNRYESGKFDWKFDLSPGKVREFGFAEIVDTLNSSSLATGMVLEKQGLAILFYSFHKSYL